MFDRQFQKLWFADNVMIHVDQQMVTSMETRQSRSRNFRNRNINQQNRWESESITNQDTRHNPASSDKSPKLLRNSISHSDIRDADENSEVSIIVSWNDCSMADYFCRNNPGTIMEYTAEISPETEIPIKSFQYYKSLPDKGAMLHSR